MRATRLRMCSKRAKSVRRPAFTGPASLSAPRPEGQDAGNSRARHQHVAPEFSERPPAPYLGPSPPFWVATSLGGRHRYVHSHRPAPWNLTFDCRESRGSCGTDFGLVGFDQGARTDFSCAAPPAIEPPTGSTTLGPQTTIAAAPHCQLRQHLASHAAITGTGSVNCLVAKKRQGARCGSILGFRSPLGASDMNAHRFDSCL